MFFVDEYPAVYREPEIFPEADVEGGAVASFDDAVFHGVFGNKKAGELSRPLIVIKVLVISIFHNNVCIFCHCHKDKEHFLEVCYFW